MKRLLLFFASTLSIAHALGQGTIIFQNATSAWGSATPNYLLRWDDTAACYDPRLTAGGLVSSNYAGVNLSKLRVVLYYGASTIWAPDNLTQTSPVGSAGYATFKQSSSANAGSWFGGYRTLTGAGGTFYAGDTVNLQIRVFDLALAPDATSARNGLGTTYLGLYGESDIFAYTIPTGSPAPTALLPQFQPFTVGMSSSPLIVVVNGQPAYGTVASDGPAQVTIARGFYHGLVYYTLNGTTPTTNSPLYTEPIALTNTTTVKTMNVSADHLQSAYSQVTVLVLPYGAPRISVNGQLAFETVVFASPAQVTITGGFTNGFVFYTLDGSMPTTSSPLYAEPITLTDSATVQAMSLSADFLQTSYAPPVQVQIVPVYTLQTSILGGGFVSASPAGGSYLSNSVVVLTATPALYWAFDHWEGDETGNQNPLSVMMNGDRNVRAVFVPTAYPLTVSTPGGGTVTANGQTISAGTYYPVGSAVSLAAAANNGWSFLRWEGDISGTNNPVSLTINQTNNVQAVFGTMMATNVVGGGAIVLGQPNPIPFGTPLTASAVPDPGNYFVTWSGAASGTGAPTTIVVNSATPTISALFSGLPAGKYSLGIVVLGNGSVAMNPRQNYYNPNDSVTLTASTTNAGNRFYGWTRDASGTNSSVVVVMNTNKTVQANFGALPTVSIWPRSLTILAGSNAVLIANAAGLPPLGYQWYKGLSMLAGETNATFNIFSAQASDAGNYSVVATNPYGAVTSEVATVTVVFPPSITQQPSSATVPAGTALTLSVGASGTTPLSYQWLTGTGPIAGATKASYTLNPIQTNNADAYFVVVTNAYGAITSTVATVTVYIPVSILAQPASRVVPARSTVSFSVLAEGYPAPAYQWKFWGTNLPDATASSLTVTNVRLADLGDYAVFVNNGYSSLLSDNATLSMSPSITSPFLGTTAIWGRNASLSVSAIGSGLLSFQWYKDWVPIAWGTNQTLDLPAVQLGDSGFYAVVVSSDWGSVTNSAQVMVNPAGMDLGLYAGITISGVAGYTYEIQYTTDLTVTNSWVTLTNLTLEQPVQLWVDTTTNAAATHQRYYRILPGQ